MLQLQVISRPAYCERKLCSSCSEHSSLVMVCWSGPPSALQVLQFPLLPFSLAQDVARSITISRVCFNNIFFMVVCLNDYSVQLKLIFYEKSLTPFLIRGKK